MEKTYSVYVHKAGSEYYTGVTTNIKWRWRPKNYKNSLLWPYIKKEGWKNITHTVIYTTTDREKAYKAEDRLIHLYATLGKSLNRRRSGLKETGDSTRYWREYKRMKQATEKEWVENYNAYHREYNRRRKEEDPEWEKKKREYNRKYNSRPEQRIYNRVRTFNRNHPDKAKETPIEAKRRYIKTGYVPDYINNSDLL